MAYAMKPVAYQDAGEIADAMMRAMYDDEHYAILLSNVSLEELIEDTAKRVPYNLSTQRGFLRHEKVIHEQTGEIVGYARWELPEHLAGNTIWPEAQMPKPTDEESKIFQQNFQSTFEHGMRRTMNREMGDYIGPVLGRNLAELIKAGPYLVLDYLITAPTHQRKGIASLLVESGAAQAKKLGLQTFVMSTPSGALLYERSGFKAVRTITLDDFKWGGETPHVTVFFVKEVT